MQDSQLSQISSFIWNTADTVLRDIFSRGKYRDVILPMTVIRRLDAMLEKTKEAVLEQKKELDKLGIADQEGPLQLAAGQQFYNASPFNLRDLRNATSQQQLRDNFIAYLDGFSTNVQDILEKFDFRNQIGRLSSSNGLDRLIERYLTRDINFSPEPVLNEDESIRLPGLDNHAMGTIFEDLLRRFNEENNEEAGEHWTPRDAVELMAKLVFLPVEDQIQSSSYVLYDGALGTGGMLTIAEDTLRRHSRKRRAQDIHPPVRTGNKRRDLCHLQGRPAPEGRNRRRRQHRGWARILNPIQRCFQEPEVRLHVEQSALRQELENGPGQDGRQEAERPKVPDPACR